MSDPKDEISLNREGQILPMHEEGTTVPAQPYSDRTRQMARQVLGETADTLSVEQRADGLVSDVFPKHDQGGLLAANQITSAGEELVAQIFAGKDMVTESKLLTPGMPGSYSDGGTLRASFTDEIVFTDTCLPGWVINMVFDYEDGADLYLSVSPVTHQFLWLSRPEAAMRFSRKSDAVLFIRLFRALNPKEPSVIIRPYVPDEFRQALNARSQVRIQPPDDSAFAPTY